MFTGLIESVGIVKAVLTIPAGVRLNVEAGMAQGVSIGDSVAVNGVCLTVSEWSRCVCSRGLSRDSTSDSSREGGGRNGS